MNAAPLVCGLALALVPAALAGPRQSSNYSVAADIIDAAGRRSSSASYANDASLGGVAGMSQSGGNACVAKAGYVGQLFEVVGLELSSSSPTINEGGAVQLAAWQQLDDATFLSLAASSVAWSVTGGPLANVTAAGVANAQIVYQDSSASVQGTFGGQSASLGLTVKNLAIDDFDSYAADGIDDAWQVQYFGLDNPQAGPLRDVNGTGQNNLFKYTAGLNPLLPPGDPNARFELLASTVPGQPGQRTLTFHPIVVGRTYTVEFNPDLAASGGGSWWPLSGFLQAPDAGGQRSLTDLQAFDPKRMYRVRITK